MNKKVWGLMLTGLSILLLFLALVCVYADARKIPDTLFLFPKAPMKTEGAAAEIKNIEERNGEDFLLTYEVNSSAAVHGLNNSHDVTLIETNHMYPYVMNTAIAAGSFFTEEAQRSDQKVAVLNKKSAFDVFGTWDITDGELKIRGEVYRVIGVIDDRDKKNLNVYVPLHFTGINDAVGRVDSFSVLMDSSDKTPEATAEGKLKQYNINSSDFHFYNMNQFVSGFWARLFLALYLLFMVLLSVFIVRSRNGIWKQAITIKKQKDCYDFGELVHVCGRSLGKLLLYLLADIAMMAALVVSLWKAVGYVLVLQDNYSRMAADYSGGFTVMINRLNQLSWFSQTAFTAFLIMLVLFAGLLVLAYGSVLSRKRRVSNSKEQ